MRSKRVLSQKEYRYVFGVAQVLDVTNSLHGPALRERANECYVDGERGVRWAAYDKRTPLGQLVDNSSAEMEANELPWQVLPPGKTVFEQVYAHYLKLKKANPGISWDMSRLKNAKDLKPSEVWVGTDHFEGYTIFRFKWTLAALLEHPITGNASYVLRRNWKTLSRETKADLLGGGSKWVRRVVHLGDWKVRLREILKQDRVTPIEARKRAR